MSQVVSGKGPVQLVDHHRSGVPPARRSTRRRFRGAGDQQRELAEHRHRVRPLGGLPMVSFCCAPGSGVVVLREKGVSNCSD